MLETSSASVLELELVRGNGRNLSGLPSMVLVNVRCCYEVLIAV